MSQDLKAQLRALGIDESNLRALTLLPLVQVAWADGRVQIAERKIILEQAQRLGLSEAGVSTVQQWLDQKPADAYFQRARSVLMALVRETGGEAVAPTNLDEVLALCQKVAGAAGGLFGIALTVEPEEKQVLMEISDALLLGGKAVSWEPPGA